MEKSSPEVRDLFLSVFDDAALSDNRGRVDFSNTIIIMTSNVGAQEIIDLSIKNPNASQQDYLSLATQALRRPKGEGRSRYESFTDEFLNRIDQICVFKPFSFEELVQVARRWVDEKSDLLQKRNLSLVVDNDVLILVAQESSDEALRDNARAVRRECERIIGSQISQWLTNNLSASNRSLHVSLEPIGDNTPDLFRVIIQAQ
jgi:ATP-dependent Clp protease ATP-binding subunit ClpA